VNYLFAFVRFYILDFASRAHVVAATTPQVRPFGSIVWAPIVVDVLAIFFNFFPKTTFNCATGASKSSPLDKGPQPNRKIALHWTSPLAIAFTYPLLTSTFFSKTGMI
jgi:hypothetical protein